MQQPYANMMIYGTTQAEVIYWWENTYLQQSVSAYISPTTTQLTTVVPQRVDDDEVFAMAWARKTSFPILLFETLPDVHWSNQLCVRCIVMNAVEGVVMVRTVGSRLVILPWGHRDVMDNARAAELICRVLLQRGGLDGVNQALAMFDSEENIDTVTFHRQLLGALNYPSYPAGLSYTMLRDGFI